MIEYYVDFRFIVKVESRTDAVEKAEAMIKEVTDDVWYTIIQSKKAGVEKNGNGGS